MINFTTYKYITPPRAENAIMAHLLGVFEKKKWIAQVKKNGTNSVIFVPPKSFGKPFAKTRHADDPEHKAWQFTPWSIKAFEDLQNDKWHVFNAELMHSKGNGIRDTNYIHDVLVYEGKYLIGSSVAARQVLLANIFRVDILKGPRSHFILDEHTWIAKNHIHDFRLIFDGLKNEDEGLVLKNPEGILTLKDNSSWAVKCRRPHSNYGF